VYAPTAPILTAKLQSLGREELIAHWLSHRSRILSRLEEFRAARALGPERIFYELCFCILTPQSSAIVCDRIVAELVERGVLRDPRARSSELRACLTATRFWRRKAEHIIRAWERFSPFAGGSILREEELEDPSRELRNRLRRRARGIGIGLKEASHFLRNLGLGGELAILDRHVLSCMRELGVVEDSELRSEKRYLEIEERVARFALETGIPLEELDLALWSAKRGMIFK